MEKLFDVYVEIIDSVFVKGKLNDVNMISFTGKVKGKYFNGEVMGSGVDTHNLYPRTLPLSSPQDICLQEQILTETSAAAL